MQSGLGWSVEVLIEPWRAGWGEADGQTDGQGEEERFKSQCVRHVRLKLKRLLRVKSGRIDVEFKALLWVWPFLN